MTYNVFDYKAYPTELKMFRATILKAKMMQSQLGRHRRGHKWLAYVNSTRTRYNFATWLIHAFYADRNITAAIVCMELGCSRKAIDEMINDWEAEGWLYKEKGTGSHSQKYYLHLSQEVLNINDEWFEWYEEEIMKLIGKAYDYYIQSKNNIQDMKSKSEFNSSDNANLSGIDDKVTSFILDSSRKRRSKGNT